MARHALVGGPSTALWRSTIRTPQFERTQPEVQQVDLSHRLRGLTRVGIGLSRAAVHGINSVARRLMRRTLGPAVFGELSVVRKALAGDHRGLLVDVGAHIGSSLDAFARDGWRVLAIEPDSTNRAELVRCYGGFPNVRIDPRAVGEGDGELVTFYTSEVSSGISTLAPFHPSHRPTAEVETVRLDSLLVHEREVTVLKTDLEGWDLMALRTFPWGRLHPRVVVSEFDDAKTTRLGYTFHDLAGFLVGCGYTVLVSEWLPVVEYGLQHEWRSIRTYPLALTDPAGWGNLIAVDPDLAPVILRLAIAEGRRLRLRRLIGRAVAR